MTDGDLPPFQACVLVLSGEPAGPYFLPLGLLEEGDAAGAVRRMQHAIDQFDPRNSLMRVPQRRDFWRGMHRAAWIPELPGTCSFSIALGLQ